MLRLQEYAAVVANFDHAGNLSLLKLHDTAFVCALTQCKVTSLIAVMRVCLCLIAILVGASLGTGREANAASQGSTPVPADSQLEFRKVKIYTLTAQAPHIVGVR